MAVTRIYTPIDNYIYLYHTDTLLILPTYPEQITDNSSASFATTFPLTRSAPIYSYQYSGPRSMMIDLKMHREMMNQVNWGQSNVTLYPGDDYVDALVKQIQAAVLPNYAASSKMVDPPMVAIRFGEDVYCKGVINGSIGVQYELPILKNGKYAQTNLSFTISEVDPYDAIMAMEVGSYRTGSDIIMNTSMDRGIYTSSSSARNGRYSGVGNSKGGQKVMEIR